MTPGPGHDGEPPVRHSRRSDVVLLIAAGVMAAGGIAVLVNLFSTRSRDAVVEASTINLLTPISGTLTALNVDAGTVVQPGEKLALVSNQRADPKEVERLKTAVRTAKDELRQLEDERVQLERQRRSYAGDASEQQDLQVHRQQAELERLKDKLRKEQEEVAYARRDLVRQEELFRAGAIAERVVDRARTDLQRNQKDASAAAQAIAAQEDVLRGARNNLNLTGTRTNFDPQPRLQEANLQLQTLKRRVGTQQQKLAGLEAQLAAALEQYQLQSSHWLVSPKQAVVWKLEAHQGDNLDAQSQVLRLINCQDRWINTYVSERDLKRVKIGAPARIDLIGEDLDLSGRVDLIRSGIGRVSPGNEDLKPVPINLARESLVRVRITNDVPAPPQKFCFVGYTGRVLFQS